MFCKHFLRAVSSFCLSVGVWISAAGELWGERLSNINFLALPAPGLWTWKCKHSTCWPSFDERSSTWRARAMKKSAPWWRRPSQTCSSLRASCRRRLSPCTSCTCLWGPRRSWTKERWDTPNTSRRRSDWFDRSFAKTKWLCLNTHLWRSVGTSGQRNPASLCAQVSMETSFSPPIWRTHRSCGWAQHQISILTRTTQTRIFWTLRLVISTVTGVTDCLRTFTWLWRGCIFRDGTVRAKAGDALKYDHITCCGVQRPWQCRVQERSPWVCRTQTTSSNFRFQKWWSLLSGAERYEVHCSFEARSCRDRSKYLSEKRERVWFASFMFWTLYVVSFYFGVQGERSWIYIPYLNSCSWWIDVCRTGMTSLVGVEKNANNDRERERERERERKRERERERERARDFWERERERERESVSQTPVISVRIKPLILTLPRLISFLLQIKICIFYSEKKKEINSDRDDFGKSASYGDTVRSGADEPKTRGQACRRSYLQAAFLSSSYLIQCRM